MVKPVARKALASAPAPCPIRPQPRVPIKPARSAPGVCAVAASACASHHALDVFPLVPVTANTGSCAPVGPKNAAASGPTCDCKPTISATGAPPKSQAFTPCASTRQAVAPRCTASATWRRASAAAPGQAMKPSPARTARLSLSSVPVTRACNQASASAGVWTRSIKNSRPRRRQRFAGAQKCQAARP